MTTRIGSWICSKGQHDSRMVRCTQPSAASPQRRARNVTMVTRSVSEELRQESAPTSRTLRVPSSCNARSASASICSNANSRILTRCNHGRPVRSIRSPRVSRLSAPAHRRGHSSPKVSIRNALSAMGGAATPGSGPSKARITGVSNSRCPASAKPRNA